MSYLLKTGALFGTVGDMPTMARDLHDDHIGALVHFAYTEDTTALEILVIGDLREVRHTIHHTGEGTSHEIIIWVTGRENTGGDKREFVLQPHQPLVFIRE